jgi:CDGSH-type Zn-finger protein
MSDVKVKVIDNGPLMVQGHIELTDGEGHVMSTKETVYLCRCGLSINKPYCNGAHKGVFDSQVRA